MLWTNNYRNYVFLSISNISFQIQLITTEPAEDVRIFTRGKRQDGKPKTRGMGLKVNDVHADRRHFMQLPKDDVIAQNFEEQQEFNLSQSYCGVIGFTGTPFTTQGKEYRKNYIRH